MTTTENVLSSKLSEAASVLSENLLQSEPFLCYREADRKLQADPEAVQLLAEFSEIQQKIRTQHDSNDINVRDIKRLRELQSIISANDTIQNHGLAEETAVAFLREINQEISNYLGVDFASLTRRSTGCC
jgi:cell fate (sporulation/competence/biofilm development) regulator YlbF (YheA/YmcA/DUF963 family)